MDKYLLVEFRILGGRQNRIEPMKHEMIENSHRFPIPCHIHEYIMTSTSPGPHVDPAIPCHFPTSQNSERVLRVIIRYQKVLSHHIKKSDVTDGGFRDAMDPLQ
jgi:hypothetical protein